MIIDADFFMLLFLKKHIQVMYEKYILGIAVIRNGI